MSNPILAEAKRLYEIGFAIIPLYPKSKQPKNNGWTTGPRHTWAEFLKLYAKGDNIGVRLGVASKIGKHYLACIDVDVKDQKFIDKAQEILAPILSYEECPSVLSGSGKGSSHHYFVTTEPFKMITLIKEKDVGEICIYSTGRQMVLAPSIHEITGKSYKWQNVLTEPNDLPLIDVSKFVKDISENAVPLIKSDWKPVAFDLLSLPDDIIDIVLEADVDDRSAALFKVALTMVREHWTDSQIMSALTCQTFELGRAAFDHAKTDSRKRAADWVLNYTIKKARSEADARYRFNEYVEVEPLTPELSAKQLDDLVLPIPWRDHIERNGPKGANPNCPKATLKNLILIFENEVAVDVFKRDEFALRDFYGHSTPWNGKKGAMLTDEDALKIKIWLSHKYRFEPKKDLIYEAMTILCERNAFDPVKEMLEAMPEWDGVNRLDSWLIENFEAEGDAEYLAQVFRKWVVAAIMRVYRPGSKFDWMPIFEGKQGIGKSSIGRILFGAKYFLDWLPDLSDKDSALLLQGAWSVEFGELNNLRKQEIEPAKAFVTRTVDKVRPPYGRRWIESPRRCVFYGTTNADTYLRDDSGNRRFKPVKVGQLNFEALEMDREQLLAEALWIWKNGLEDERSLEIDGDAKIFEAKIQGDKMVEDEATLMKEEILDFIKKPDENAGIDLTKFRIKSLFESFGPLAKWKGDHRDTMNASKAIKSLGALHWKSDGIKVWSLKSSSGIPRGILKNIGIPVKNTNEFNN